ncbi:hypothetical protein BDV41DRAFT_554130 [Aspergillus transmontanensis]|uniref:CCHC-type domain-containing protein n=1 Tax=Aspergillus transmontanensis TaxID=1034304 RepID=A0A5N6VGR5_9EURO|nr:hypothetical protein BDV41DRAFT_554130 [Aspergillus transmontanensis]
MSFQAGGRGCFNCGDASHQARDCPKKGTPTCYNCGGMLYPASLHLHLINGFHNPNTLPRC